METKDIQKPKKKKKFSKFLLNIIIFWIIFLVVWLLSTYVFHNGFIWQKEKPLNYQNFWTRQMVNFIILLVLFIILYYTRVYEFINNFIWWVFSNKEEKNKYEKTKLIVWIIILVLLYFFVVPKTIKLTNSISSFLINIGKLFIHLIPVFLISFALYFVFLLALRHRNKQKENAKNALDLEKMETTETKLIDSDSKSDLEKQDDLLATKWWK